MKHARSLAGIELCPVPDCGARRERWQAVCRHCWGLLPVDRKRAIMTARRIGARHIEAKESIAATAWLAEQMPQRAAARVCGERPG